MRLFGNVFAGEVLLATMIALAPILIPAVFLGLELLFGFVQALVFALLAMTYIGTAIAEHHTAGHGEDDHGGADAVARRDRLHLQIALGIARVAHADMTERIEHAVLRKDSICRHQIAGNGGIVVKTEGEFVWHKHDETDDFFLVLAGRLTIQLRDRDGGEDKLVAPETVMHHIRGTL